VFNPPNERVERTITVPLYYTGLTEKAMIREQEGKNKKFELA